MSSTTPASSTSSTTPPTGPRLPRVVVGVDGSPCSAEALTWTLRHAVQAGAQVEAVACWQAPTLAMGVGYGAYIDASTYDMTGPTTEMLEKAVAAGVGEVPGAEAVDVQCSVLEAYPARALLAAAEGADLLVVGSRGHGELSAMLLGSVGLHCVTHSSCPVVVVRGGQQAQAGDA